jgi:hypothetical protein
MAIRPSSWAGRLASAPLKDPTGVRAAETMTMSLIGGSLLYSSGPELLYRLGVATGQDLAAQLVHAIC